VISEPLGRNKGTFLSDCDKLTAFED